MRLPAATSRSGMLQKCFPPRAMTSSTSGRGSEPPRTVMVPWPLMTVVTPSSSKTFPVEPKPVSFLLAAGVEPAGAASVLIGLSTAAESALSMPRNVLRFDWSLNAMELCPLLDNRCDAVDFDERLARESGDGDGCTCRAAVRKIRFENGIHAVVVIELCEKDGELKNAVHG